MPREHLDRPVVRVPLRIEVPLYTAFRAIAYEKGLSLNAAAQDAIALWVKASCEAEPHLLEQVQRKVKELAPR